MFSILPLHRDFLGFVCPLKADYRENYKILNFNLEKCIHNKKTIKVRLNVKQEFDFFFSYSLYFINEHKIQKRFI